MENNIKNEIGPLDIIKMIFTDKPAFDSLSNLILSKHFYIINRRFAIKYPLQAECFNNLKINPGEVIRAWANFLILKEGYGKIPGFLYTRGIQKIKKKQDEKQNIPSEELKQYAKYYNLSLKDVNDLKLFSFDKLKEDIKRLQEMFKTKNQIEKIV